MKQQQHHYDDSDMILLNTMFAIRREQIRFNIDNLVGTGLVPALK